MFNYTLLSTKAKEICFGVVAFGLGSAQCKRRLKARVISVRGLSQPIKQTDTLTHRPTFTLVIVLLGKNEQLNQ